MTHDLVHPPIKNCFATLLSVCAPTLDANEDTKDAFYECLDAAICKMLSLDKLILRKVTSVPGWAAVPSYGKES